MAWGSSESNIIYSQPIDAVFDAVVLAAQSLKYNVKLADRASHTVTINIGMSMFTWGEVMTVSLFTINDGRTSVIFSCKSKLGTEIAANSKNKKNISKLTEAMQNFLK